MTDEYGETPLGRTKENYEIFPDYFSVALYLIDCCECGGEKERLEVLTNAFELGKLDVAKEIIEKHSINLKSKLNSQTR